MPHPKGFLIDTGSLARVLEHDDRKPVVVGKPSYWMQQALLRAMQGHVDKSVIIGDSLTSDIGIGNSLDIDTVLVCSGVTSIHQIRHAVQLPTAIFPSVREIYQLIKG
ncbi:HAD hydrolase-like protein [Bacillus sp. JCM 19041]|uniref:HAD hydrolase-like protein n=1 Tax=Bacillus sp. JCM 19041 TaxID=1460637 RepID=UPI0006D2B04E